MIRRLDAPPPEHTMALPLLPAPIEAALTALRSAIEEHARRGETLALPLPEVVAGLLLPPLPVDLPRLLEAIEDQYVDGALAFTQGNRAAAATLLGLRRTTLVEKLRRRHAEHGADGRPTD